MGDDRLLSFYDFVSGFGSVVDGYLRVQDATVISRSFSDVIGQFSMFTTTKYIGKNLNFMDEFFFFCVGWEGGKEEGRGRDET